MRHILLSGTSNPPLAQHISRELADRYSTGNIEVRRFSDGEIRVELHENVRGTTAYIIQSTQAPANDTLMELALIADALKRASADKVVAVVPYFGYARQDRKPGYSRVPISARVVADILEGAGVDHVVTVDLHATQIQGFFKIPVDNLTASNLFANDIRTKWLDQNPIIVSPDVGGVARARSVAERLPNVELAIVDKRRPMANVSEVMNIVGDITDKTCIIVDDMVDTAGTLCSAASALLERGARQVVAYASHGVLSGLAHSRLDRSVLQELVITDSILQRGEIQSKKVRYLPLATMISDTIRRVAMHDSVSSLMTT